MKSNILQNTKWLTIISGVGLGLVLIAAPTQVALTAPNATLTASVPDQQCQGGDFVNVTLTASCHHSSATFATPGTSTTTGSSIPAPSRNPSVTHLYPDETNQTAKVKVTKRATIRRSEYLAASIPGLWLTPFVTPL